MTTAVPRAIAESRPADVRKSFVVSATEQMEIKNETFALSMVLPYRVTKPLIEAGATPRRPNRNRPENLPEPIRGEQALWDELDRTAMTYEQRDELWKHLQSRPA